MKAGHIYIYKKRQIIVSIQQNTRIDDRLQSDSQWCRSRSSEVDITTSELGRVCFDEYSYLHGNSLEFDVPEKHVGNLNSQSSFFLRINVNLYRYRFKIITYQRVHTHFKCHWKFYWEEHAYLSKVRKLINFHKERIMFI